MPSPILPASELILNPNGSIYHLRLHPDELANTVMLVGDPRRVPVVSAHFDEIEVKRVDREFVTHTGHIGGTRLTVLSTGMGCDNIDIVLNELDALVNIDFETRTIKEKTTSLNLIRMGTCGCLHKEVGLDELIVSDMSIGLANLMEFYQHSYTEDEQACFQQFKAHYPDLVNNTTVFTAQGYQPFVEQLTAIATKGHTVTFPGFFGPQGRALRGPLRFANMLDQIASFSFNQATVLNFEMETAGIYALSRLLNHRACALSTVVAQRSDQTFTKNVEESVENMIKKALPLIISLANI